MASGQGAANIPTASTTLTATTVAGIGTANAGPSSQATLRLRGVADSSSGSRHVTWNNGVIDNEHMGKKSSKICCIYHRRKLPGESSSEESDSDSSEGSDSEPDLSRAQPTRRAGDGHDRGRCEHDHDHDEPDGSVIDGQSDNPRDKAPARNPPRKRSPNAYERMPKPRPRKT